MKVNFTLTKKLYPKAAGLISLVLTLFASQSIVAQLTGTKNIPGNYATLELAITDLNTVGVGAGGVTINLLAGNPQTAPAAGYSITTLTGTVANPIIIQGNGNTITAFASPPVGQNYDAIFKIIGGDYITIQNFSMTENPSNTTGGAVGVQRMTEFGVGLFAATPTDGAQNNIIQNNTITLGSATVYQNAIGIFSTTASSSTNAAQSATSTAGTNSNNKFYSNTISGVATGIYFISPPQTATLFESGNDIGGTSLSTGNTITFAINSLAGDLGFTNYSGTTSAGIYFRNIVGNTARFNTLTSVTTSTLQRAGIFTAHGTNPTGITYTTTFNDNIITVTNAGTTAITGIDFGSGLATGTIVGSNNNITLNQAVSNFVNAAIIGIKGNYQSATITLNNNSITTNQTSSFNSIQSPVTGINTAATTTTTTVNSNIITVKQNPTTGAGNYGTATLNYIIVAGPGVTPGTITVNSNQLLTTGSTIRTTGDVFGINHYGHTINGITINQNTINIDKQGQFGAVYGTYESTPSSASPSYTITNNAFTFTVTGSYTITAIHTLGGNCSTCSPKNISSNTISVSGPTIGSTKGIVTGWSRGNITSNTITLSTEAVLMTGVDLTQSNSGTYTVNLNKITISTTAGFGTLPVMNGIIATAPGVGPTKVVSDTISITAMTASAPTITGISLSSTAGSDTIANNVIKNIATGAGTGLATITGIAYGSGSSPKIYNNKLYDIGTDNSTANSVVHGIRISGGQTSVDIFNNYIGNLTAPFVPSTDAIRGINITSTQFGATINVFYNTVYLNATGPATFGTTGIYHTTNAATNALLNLRNNIIVNTSTASGGGFTVAYRRSSTNLANYASTSNNNLFYAGTASSPNFIFHDGTTGYQMPAFQTLVAPRDAVSFTETVSNTPGVFFQSFTGNDLTFLHMVNGAVTQVESGAVNIAGYTIDYDSNIRQGNPGYSGTGTAPDVGADEFEGVRPPPMVYSSSTTTQNNTSILSPNSINQEVIGIQIVTTGLLNPLSATSFSLNTNGSTSPATDITNAKLFFTGSSSAFSAVNQFGTSVAAPNGSFSFTGSQLLNQGTNYFWLTYDILPGATSGNVVDAQCTSLTVGSAHTPTVQAPAGNRTIRSVSVTATSGNTGPVGYNNLTDAFVAVNSGIHQGAITIDLKGNTTESTTATINASGSGSASYTSILVRAGGGVAISVSGAMAAGNPLIDFNGADNVTMDGLNSGGNSLTIVNTTLSATAGTSTIRFIGGAINNTITRCAVQGSFSGSVGVTGGNIFFSTDAVTTDGNDNNTISLCNIGPAGSNLPTKGIYGKGSTTSLAIGNSGIVINNNNIFDIFGSGVTSAGIYTEVGCNTWTITDNRVYQTASRTWATGAQHSGIWVTPVVTNGPQGYTITGNIIGFSSNTQTGTYSLSGAVAGARFVGIHFAGMQGGTTTAISNNTIAAVSMTGSLSSGTASSSPFIGIFFQDGVGIVNNNTIGSQTGNGSLTFSTTATTSTELHGIYNSSVSVFTANNNNIGSISLTTTSTGFSSNILYGLRSTPSAGNAAFNAMSNNIGGTTSNSIQLNAAGNNSQVIGITTNNNPSTISSNTVRNLTSNQGANVANLASVLGILLSTTTGNNTISQNTLHTLSNTNTTIASAVNGIVVNSTATYVLERNFIYALLTATSSSNSEVNGIYISSGVNTVINNMIGLGAGITTSGSVYGIREVGGTNNFYHNSIYLAGAPVTGTGNSFSFSSTIQNIIRNIKNNIFVNTRSNNGATGKHYAVRVGGTAPNPAGLSINYNVYYIVGTGTMFGSFNNLDVVDLPAWQIAVGQDVSSLQANPQFNDPINAIPDLHLHSSNATPAEGTGESVGVADDYDGQSRTSFTPIDIGADAGNFNALYPAMVYVSSTVTQTNTSNALTNLANQLIIGIQIVTTGLTYPLTATSFTLNTNGTTSVSDIANAKIFYTGNSSSFATTSQFGSTVATPNGSFLISGSTALIQGTNYFWVTYDIPCGSTPGNFIDAECNSLTVGTSHTPSVQAPVGNRMIVTGPLSGVRTIGTSGDYQTLSQAASAINLLGLGGNTTLSILENITEPGVVTFNQWFECGGSNLTLTIKPAASTSPTITSNAHPAVIILNGADRVTIDGSAGNSINSVCPPVSASRDLTITTTNIFTSSAIVWLQSASGNGSTNNTVMNCNLVGNLNATVIGAGSGSPTIGTSSLGTGNNNNSFINNNISKSWYGIFSQGASAANKNTGTIINQNVMNTLAPNNVSRGGIWTGYENNITIAGNIISEISYNVSLDVFGITLGVGTTMASTSLGTNEVTNATVTKNTIGNVINSGTHSAAGISVAASSSGTNLISNNMIYGVASNGTAGNFGAGIVLGGASGSITKVYYNTIFMQDTITGAQAATQTSACLAVVGSTPPLLDIKNNIFSNTQIGNTNATLRFATIALGYSTFTTLTSDNNDLYAAGNGPGTYQIGITGNVVGGTNHTTLSNWQTNTGKDALSLNMLPVFISPTNLHINKNIASNFVLNDAAAGLAEVTDDVDCEVRMTDIGADEFNPCIRVINTNDTGDGSLRDAIACAANGATITFAPSLLNQTIVLTSGEIAINKDLVMSGLGMTGLTVSGNNSSRIFNILSGKVVAINNLSLKNATSLVNGGALFVEGNLTLQNILLQNNFQNGLPKAWTLSAPGMVTVAGNVDIKN